MKTTGLLVVGLALSTGCDENKYAGMLEASASATVSVAALPSVAPSSNPLPPPTKKKQWKCASAPGVVDFEGDTALEQEVRIKLAKPQGLISPAELANVHSLNYRKYGPQTELNPCLLPKFTQMHDIFVSGDDFDDLSPVADLTSMITLVAIQNKVKNLDPLKKLVHLDRLDLSHSQVADISVVAQMTELTELSLDTTSVTDLTPLSKLTKLEKVSLANTAIKDVSPLKNCKNLKSVDISGTPVTDTSMLQGKNLKIKS